MTTKQNLHECPNCQKRSLVLVDIHIYKCTYCKHKVDLNEQKSSWLLPAISLGVITSLVVAGELLANFPQFTQTKALESFSEMAIAKPIEISQLEAISIQPILKVKAISGNRVVVSGQQEVFLCGVNAPVLQSVWHIPATQNLQKFLDAIAPSDLEIVVMSNDHNIPLVMLYNRRNLQAGSINAQQIASGYGFTSGNLVRECQDRDRMLDAAELARQQKYGLWQS
jgi:DNA-directed RNA polymerase subunit RPC12/RpoP/endonuclease YncB( thermonuclease family)